MVVIDPDFALHVGNHLARFAAVQVGLKHPEHGFLSSGQNVVLPDRAIAVKVPDVVLTLPPVRAAIGAHLDQSRRIDRGPTDVRPGAGRHEADSRHKQGEGKPGRR